MSVSRFQLRCDLFGLHMTHLYHIIDLHMFGMVFATGGTHQYMYGSKSHNNKGHGVRLHTYMWKERDADSTGLLGRDFSKLSQRLFSRYKSELLCDTNEGQGTSPKALCLLSLLHVCYSNFCCPCKDSLAPQRPDFSGAGRHALRIADPLAFLATTSVLYLPKQVLHTSVSLYGSSST